MMNVDIEIYISQLITFFEKNPGDFMDLVGEVQKEEFFQKMKEKSIEKLTAKGFDVDYIEITDKILRRIKTAEKKETIVALIAATIGEVRLIDNMILNNANNGE